MVVHIVKHGTLTATSAIYEFRHRNGRFAQLKGAIAFDVPRIIMNVGNLHVFS